MNVHVSDTVVPNIKYPAAANAVSELANAFHLTLHEVCTLLGLSTDSVVHSLESYKASDLSPDTLDRIQLYEQMRAILRPNFKSSEVLCDWMNVKRGAFGGLSLKAFMLTRPVGHVRAYYGYLLRSDITL
jgi:hypothetical protein